MRRRGNHRTAWIGAVALALAGAAILPVEAQTTETPHPGQAGAGMDGKVVGAGSGSAMGAAGDNTVATGQGGVAGTGLGKTPTGDDTGKGMSVKGPAGQGLKDKTP